MASTLLLQGPLNTSAAGSRYLRLKLPRWRCNPPPTAECQPFQLQVVQDFRLYSYAQHLVQQYRSQLSGQQAWEPEAQQHVLLDDNEDEHEDEEQQGQQSEQPQEQQQQPQQQPEEQQGEQQTEAERQAEEQQQAEGPPAELADGRLPPPVSLLSSLGARSAGSRQTGASAEARLRIVFQKRDGLERQLVNAAELVKLCNRWRYTAPSGALVTALCWQVRRGVWAAGLLQLLIPATLHASMGCSSTAARAGQLGTCPCFAFLQINCHGPSLCRLRCPAWLRAWPQHSRRTS